MAVTMLSGTRLRQMSGRIGSFSGSSSSIPVNLTVPTISGTPSDGNTLTATTGTWSGPPTGYAYQWYRSGVMVTGQTATTYAVGIADVGMTITVRVTATNAVGSASATSAGTAISSGASSGQTNVFRESFAEGTILTSGSPGSNFGTVTGSIYGQYAGPRIAAGPTGGSSACGSVESSGSSPDWTAEWTYSGLGASAQPYPIGMVCCWWKPDAYPTTAGNDLNLFGLRRTGGGTFGLRARGTNAGALANATASAVGNQVTYVPEIGRWHYLCFAYDGTTGGVLRTRSYYMRLGADAAPVLFDSTDNGFPINDFNRVYLGLTIGRAFRGRIGGFSAYKLSALTDAATYPHDLIPPIDEERTTYFVNASTGSDSNNGRSTGAPWATWAKIVAEHDRGTILSARRPWVYDSTAATVDLTYTNVAQRIGLADSYDAGTIRPNGDVIAVVPGTDLPITAKLRMRLPGVTLCSATDNTLAVATAFKTMSGTWTQYDAGTYPNVWQLADSQTSSILWEDRVWLNHPQGAAITNVRTSLNTTPGSYWTDGTTMYLHTFDSANPNSNGRVYERSRNVAGSLIAMTESALVRDLDVSGAALIDNLNTPSVPAQYHIASEAWAGLQVMDGCTTTYYGKHPTAAVGDGIGGMMLRKGCIAGQGIPGTYRDSTGTSVPSVDGGVDYYGATVGDANMTSFWRDCTNPNPVGVVGSSAGTTGGKAYYSHHINASARQIVYLEFLRCNMAGSVTPNADSTPLCVVEDSTFYSYEYSATGGVSTVDRSIMTTQALNCNAGTLTATDSWVKWLGTLNASGNYGPTGNIVLNSCTLDLSGATTSNDNSAIWELGTGSTLALADSAIIFPSGAGNTVSLAKDGTLTKTIAVTQTAFEPGVSTLFLTNYNDGSTTADRTYAQAVTLGLVTSSVTAADIGVNTASLAALEAGSVCIGLATVRVDAPDLTGVIFASRADSGCREYVV